MFPADLDEDFWPLARRAIDGLAAARSPDGILAGMRAMEAFVPVGSDSKASCGFVAAGLKFDVMVTNLGALPLRTEFGPLRLEAVWGPAVLSQMMNEQVVGVSTLAGRLRLVHTSHEPVVSLLDAVHETLLDACAER